MKNINSTIVLVVSLLVGIVLFGGLIWYLKENKAEEEVTLPITFEEFADFQCPACGTYFPLIEEIRSEYPAEEVEFKFRHLPLTGNHEYAYDAAVASEAAREQEKFYEYYRLLFENQDRLTEDDLIAYAEELELDMEQFNADRNSDEVRGRVDADMAEADSRGFNSTPTFVLDGRRLSMGNDPATQLRELIQERIDLARSQDPAGTEESTTN